MTNIFIKNDKSTVKNEIALLLIIIGCVLAGVLLIVFRPEFWVVSKVHTAVLGVLLILAGAMLVPGLLYRLFTNTEK